MNERCTRSICLRSAPGIEAGVAYVMTSYNQLNGVWAGQNSRVIGELLRGELGFRGCVMSDWSSVYDTEKVVKSGQNVEMPGRREFVEEVRELLRQGCISEKDLERMIRPNVATAVAFGLYDRVKYRPDLLGRFPAHAETACEVAAKGTVLLRNNGILPLAVGRQILLTGRFIREIPRTGGSTSSSAEVLGYDNVSLADAVRAEFGDAVQVVERPTREQLAAADVVLHFGGNDRRGVVRASVRPAERRGGIYPHVCRSESEHDRAGQLGVGNPHERLERSGCGGDLRLVSRSERHDGLGGNTLWQNQSFGEAPDHHRKGVCGLSGQRDDAGRCGVLQQGAAGL